MVCLPTLRPARWGPKCKRWLSAQPSFCWTSYHSGTPVTRTSILGEGQVWLSSQVSQRKFSITIVLSKAFKLQQESSEVCYSISLLLGITFAWNVAKSPSPPPQEWFMPWQVFTALSENPWGTEAGCPLTHLSLLHWPETLGRLWHRPQEQQIGAQVSTERKRARRLEKGNEIIGEKTEIWGRVKGWAGWQGCPDSSVFGPEGSLTARGERKRISVLSQEKFGRKTQTDLTCQGSPNYRLLSQFLSVAQAGNSTKESLVALRLWKHCGGGTWEMGGGLQYCLEFGAMIFVMT